MTTTNEQPDEWVEVRSRTGELLFKLDPERLLVQIKSARWRRGEPAEVVDLRPYLGCGKRVTRPHGRAI